MNPDVIISNNMDPDPQPCCTKLANKEACARQGRFLREEGLFFKGWGIILERVFCYKDDGKGGGGGECPIAPHPKYAPDASYKRKEQDQFCQKFVDPN